MKESEYGGTDTDRTGGTWPSPPHVLSASEKLTKLYESGDPSDPMSGDDIVGEIGKA